MLLQVKEVDLTSVKVVRGSRQNCSFKWTVQLQTIVPPPMKSKKNRKPDLELKT